MPCKQKQVARPKETAAMQPSADNSPRRVSDRSGAATKAHRRPCGALSFWVILASSSVFAGLGIIVPHSSACQYPAGIIFAGPALPGGAGRGGSVRLRRTPSCGEAGLLPGGDGAPAGSGRFLLRRFRFPAAARLPRPVKRQGGASSLAGASSPGGRRFSPAGTGPGGRRAVPLAARALLRRRGHPSRPAARHGQNLSCRRTTIS